VNLRRFILSLYLLFILGLGVVGGVYFLEARAEYERLRKVETENRRRLADAQARLRQQEQVLERMRTDPAYVEQVIRRKLGWTKPDEFIFRFEN
jgi:cell division protein FtsB